jgi:hypothetical protein
MNQKYPYKIRSNSAYPVYRGVINIITMLFYLVAALFALVAVVGGMEWSIDRSSNTGVGVVALGLTLAVMSWFAAASARKLPSYWRISVTSSWMPALACVLRMVAMAQSRMASARFHKN